MLRMEACQGKCRAILLDICFHTTTQQEHLQTMAMYHLQISHITLVRRAMCSCIFAIGNVSKVLMVDQ